MNAGRGAHVPIKLERQPDTVKIESTSVDDDIGGCLQAGDAAGVTAETEPLGASDSWIVIGDKVMHKVERVVKKGTSLTQYASSNADQCAKESILSVFSFSTRLLLRVLYSQYFKG